MSNLENILAKTEELNKQLLKYKSERAKKNPLPRMSDDDVVPIRQGIDKLVYSYNTNPSTYNAKPVNLMSLSMEAKKLYTDPLFSASCNSKSFFSTNKCTEFIKQWNLESQSTIYWLRFLSYCIVRVRRNNNPPTVIIDTWNEVWANCKKRIVFPDQKRRVIMGIGPSGCGKSTIAKTVFPWFTDIETVVFIDGGISREVSTVWNVATAFSNGISDLYKIFSGHSSKDEMFTLLQPQSCSFYIADTLSNQKNAENYAYYISGRPDTPPDLTKYTSLDEEWIALFIWQHLNVDKSEKKCTYPNGYRCIGCDISGQKRQISEGKPYDSKAYIISKHASLLALKQSKHKFFIHNSGSGDDRTVIAYNSTAITSEILRQFENTKLAMMRIDGMEVKTFKEINKEILAKLNTNSNQFSNISPDIRAILENQQQQLSALQRAVTELVKPKAKKTWRSLWRGGLKTRKMKKYKSRKHRSTPRALSVRFTPSFSRPR